jgi:DNA-binding SARP family transcriptional activator
VHLATDELRIQICGRLALQRGDALVPESALPARQGRRLWAFLVLNRAQPIGRIDLADALWGDDAPDAWDAVLSGVVSRLRTAIAPIRAADGPSIVSEPNRYSLKLPPQTQVDFERARNALHRTDVLVRSGAWQEALGEARVAAEIAARGFLPGESGAWVEGARGFLGSVQHHAQAYTVEAELARGHADTAEREAEILISLDPLNERAHQLLMRSLAARGNYSGVTRALNECRRIMATESLEPSRATEVLAADLAAGGHTG